jgi:hypothetical protein
MRISSRKRLRARRIRSGDSTVVSEREAASGNYFGGVKSAM